ncbi:MAG: porin family protein [Bacteroidetes bacterium]|nr:porin family protein [Bacteroidota bacterium]
MILVLRPTHAQRFLGGISVGANFTQVDGDQFYGFRHVGLNIGPMAILPFGKNKNWSVSMELLYSQKGSYHKGSTDSTYYRLNLDYIDIPLMFHFTDKKIISAGVGICYGQLINKSESTLPDSIMVPNSNFLPYDLSALGEVSVRLWNRLWINVRYQYSMMNLRTVTFKDPNIQGDTWTRNQYNNVISLRLTYIFNQELPGKPKKAKGDGEVVN